MRINQLNYEYDVRRNCMMLQVIVEVNGEYLAVNQSAPKEIPLHVLLNEAKRQIGHEVANRLFHGITK